MKRNIKKTSFLPLELKFQQLFLLFYQTMKNTISIPSLQITVFCAFYVSCVHGYSVIFPNFVIGQQNSFLSKADKTFLYSILKGIVNIYKSYISNIEVKNKIRQYLTLSES